MVLIAIRTWGGLEKTVVVNKLEENSRIRFLKKLVVFSRSLSLEWGVYSLRFPQSCHPDEGKIFTTQFSVIVFNHGFPQSCHPDEGRI
jgi:hypothetical protein